MDNENLNTKQPTVINCPQCGGTVAVEGDGVYASCPYCNSTFYFKDREATILAQTVYDLDKKLEKDEELTKDARDYRFAGLTLMIITGILYFVCAIALGFFVDSYEKSQTGNFMFVFIPWLTANGWTFFNVINAGVHHKGYDVYTNEQKTSTKVLYILKWIGLCKVCQWLSFMIATIAYVIIFR